jgi:tetratricopeptide (TPR) repeat protein
MIIGTKAPWLGLGYQEGASAELFEFTNFSRRSNRAGCNWCFENWKFSASLYSKMPIGGGCNRSGALSMADDGVAHLRIVGPFRLTRSDGGDATPANRKSRALLALLAMSPGRKRTRGWLQDRLWGTRGREQGAASIRQCLADIRKNLGPDRACLLAGRTDVGLDESRIRIDIDALDLSAATGSGDVVLLEGLDIPYESFSSWLREQRQIFSERIAARAELPAIPAEIPRSCDPGNVLFLSRCDSYLSEVISEQADDLLDHVGRTISELGIAQVIDRRRAGPDAASDSRLSRETSGLSLHARCVGAIESSGIRLSLTSRPENEFIWSSLLEECRDDQRLDKRLALISKSNDIVGMTIERFTRLKSRTHAPSAAAALAQEGIRTMYRLGEQNFRMADTLFSSAFDLHPRGLFLAWRAYLRTFLLVEQGGLCRKALEEEAFGFLRRALELEPNNSYVLAFGAHVHSILRRSYAAAYEFAERSVGLNPANPIGWACLGIAQCYLGKSSEGLKNTLRARSIAGYAPFRYQMDTLACIAATMANDFDTAIHLGESSHSLAPDFAAPMRYLAALYTLREKESQAYGIVEKMRRKEPDFSYLKLRDKSYPAAGLHRTEILDRLPAL